MLNCRILSMINLRWQTWMPSRRSWRSRTKGCCKSRKKRLAWRQRTRSTKWRRKRVSVSLCSKCPFAARINIDWLLTPCLLWTNVLKSFLNRSHLKCAMGLPISSLYPRTVSNHWSQKVAQGCSCWLNIGRLSCCKYEWYGASILPTPPFTQKWTSQPGSPWETQI